MPMTRILRNACSPRGPRVRGARARAVDITGAGATFPYPIYAKWAEAYKKKTGNGMNYQSIGSGGGIKQIKAKTVDFGASDMPLKAEDLQKTGLVQFPAIMGGVVPIVNLEGIAPGQLKFTGPLLADIYLGKIKKWNDPAIAELNPGVEAAGATRSPWCTAPTARARRSCGPTTCRRSSPECKTKVGAGTAVKWPEGVGGKGNEGVAAYVQRIKGSIGYVEYAYAKQNKLSHAAMQNKDGQFVQPDDTTFKAAAAGADWKSTPGLGVILTDQPGKASWPITGASFILMHAKQEKPQNGARSAASSSTGRSRTARRWPTSSTTCRCPTPWSKQIAGGLEGAVKDASGKALWN